MNNENGIDLIKDRNVYIINDFMDFNSIPVLNDLLKKIKEKDHEQVANDMLEAEFRHCYHAAVFFYAVFKESILNLSPFLESQTEKKMELKEAMMNFKNLL